MRNRLAAAVWMMCVVLACSAMGETVWSEDFNDPAIQGKGADGTGTDMTGITKWSIDVSGATLADANDWFKVNNNLFEGRDLDGTSAAGAEAIWISESIDISGHTGVGFSLDALESGDHEAADYFDVEYRIDGGTWTLITNWNSKGSATHTLVGDIPDDGDWISETVTGAGLAGSTLEIRVRMNNNADTEYLRLDNLIVTGAPAGSNDADSYASDPASQIAGGTVSSTVDTPGEAIDAIAFRITDPASGDGLPTKVTQLVLRPGAGNTADWTDTIGGVALAGDAGAIALAATVINDSSLTLSISTGNLDVADGATANLTLALYLADGGTLADGSELELMIDGDANGFQAHLDGSTFSSDFGSDIVSNVKTVEVAATSLTFTDQPAGVLVDSNFGLAVAATDDNGNIDTDVSTNVSLSLDSGSGVLSSVSGLSAGLAAGQATWTDLQIDTVGVFTLLLEDSLLTPATSAAITAKLREVIINEWVQAISGYNEWIELLVVGDGVDLRGWTLNDDSHAPDQPSFRFRSADIWSNVPAGTLIVVYDDDSAKDPALPANDLSLDDGNFVIVAPHGELTLFDDTGYWNAFNNADDWDNPKLRDSDDFLIHDWDQGDQAAFTDDTTRRPDESGDASAFLGGTAEDVVIPSFWILLTGATGTTPGAANGGNNTTAIRDLRRPSLQASNIVFSAVQPNQMTVAWQPGDGNDHLVVARKGGPVDALPADGVTYADDPGFGIGDQVGSSNYVIYAGSDTSVTMVALSHTTTYHLRVFSFRGNGSDDTAYLADTAAGNPASQQTTVPTHDAESDIVRTGGETDNIAYDDYQAADLTAAASVSVLTFSIRDGGADNTGSDTSATELTGITFTGGNYGTLRRVGLYDGTTEIAESTPVANQIVFSGLGGANVTAPDEGTRELTLRASFLDTVTDNQQLDFTVQSASADTGGSTFAAPDAGGAASSTAGDANRLEVTATKLAFTVSAPAEVWVDREFAVAVVARDALNNSDLDSAAAVSIGLDSGTGNLSGGAAAALVNGEGSWSSLTYDTVETFVIRAAAAGLSPAISAGIDALASIEPGAIAFVAYQFDTPDGFAFVALRDIPSGAVVSFTDDGWNGTDFRGDAEESGSWTAPAAGIRAGSVVRIHGSTVTGGGAWSGEALTGLSSSGDQLLAFHGTRGTPAFIGGVSSMDWMTAGDPTSNQSYLPSPLALGTTAVGFASEIDNGYYVGPLIGKVGELLGWIYDADNWVRNTSLQTWPDPWSFTVLAPGGMILLR